MYTMDQRMYMLLRNIFSVMCNGLVANWNSFGAVRVNPQRTGSSAERGSGRQAQSPPGLGLLYVFWRGVFSFSLLRSSFAFSFESPLAMRVTAKWSS